MTQTLKLPKYVKQIIVIPPHLSQAEFRSEAALSGLRIEQVVRADSREAAEFKQQCWADRGIESIVVTLLERANGQPL